jgi:aminodeoxyfutalosine deaminase
MDTSPAAQVRSMSADARTLTARWVFPASSPPLPGGTVTIHGDRIEAVEPHGVRTADENLGNVALIPGLVNAHTHLDLSGARGLIPPTDPDHFTDWLKGVIAFRRTRSEEQTLADIETGLAECLRFGTTLIGDIASEGRSWKALAAAKTRAVVFWELIGLSEERARTAFTLFQQWKSARVATPCTRGEFSPHAPYSAHRISFDAGPEAVVATHLAESPGELELLRTRTGPFITFLSDLGVYDESEFGSLDRILVRSRYNRQTLLAHCNYLPYETWKYINGGGHTVVYCPRTHAAFGHPPHPFREFLARGVRVCLGTDSLASNPDLDILAEARFVHAKYPDFPGEQLLKMVTLSGAEALGWADECGSLEAGKSAGLVAVPLPEGDGEPHELLFSDTPGERRTMWRGEWRE